MKTRIAIFIISVLLAAPLMHAQKSVQEILMSHSWYEEPRPGFEESKLVLGWDEVPRTGFDFGKDSVRTYLFGRKDPVGKNISFFYPYYLSDTPPDEAFDHNKVGNTSNGKYLIMLEIHEGRIANTLVYELVKIENQHIELRRHNLKNKDNVSNKIWRPRP